MVAPTSLDLEQDEEPWIRKGKGNGPGGGTSMNQFFYSRAHSRENRRRNERKKGGGIRSRGLKELPLSILSGFSPPIFL
jgi:hypothetical protein